MRPDLLSVDSAFVDRADIIQYVDLPPREAIYEILRSCVSELVTKGIIADVVSLKCCIHYNFGIL